MSNDSKLCRIGYSMSRFSYYFTCFAIKLTKFWIRIWKYLLGSISSWQNHFPVLSCFIDYCLKYNSISLLWLFSKHCTGMIQFFRTFFPCKCIMILILFFYFFLKCNFLYDRVEIAPYIFPPLHGDLPCREV